MAKEGGKVVSIVEVFKITEDELEERLHHSHVAGKDSAYQHVTAMLQTKAGQLFTAGKDEEARMIRELLRKVEEHGKATSAELQKCIDRAFERNKIKAGS